MSLLYNLRKSILVKRYSSKETFRKFYEEVDTSRKVKETTFTVLDTETTSPDIKRARLLSVGALKIENMSVELSTAFHRFVLQEGIEKESVEVHGITEEDLLSKGEPVEAVLEDLLEYAKGTVIVGFNVEFDKKVIERDLKRLFGVPLPMPRLDLLNLLKRTDVAGKTLEGIAKELDIPIGATHSALDDAYTTALLFLRLAHPFRESPLFSLPLMI